MAAACLRLASFPPCLTDATSVATRLSSSGGSSGSSGSGSVPSAVRKESAPNQVAFAKCSRNLTRGMTSWGPLRALLDGHGFQLDAKADVIEAGSFSNGVNWSKLGLWRWKLPAAAGVGSAVLAGDDSIADEEVIGPLL
ncbi:hypothetical protein CBR_g3729 [Chara braunii]|uniref:Uncharacterized protein n=1 Tax=Chara braunii TaxID=69332 RepID=A0A388KG63_CHABU|nr:hypothetical protein CBR_g3729 [Chara braunii]|eukprot:GBG69031.1 hypothetical protein CBR_g3729 [Chara braunii]